MARLTAVVAAVAAAVAAVLVVESARDADLAVLAVMVSGVAVGLGWLALRHGRRRDEWCYGDRRLTLLRRDGARARLLFEATALELTRSHDGDGDPWYELEALSAGRDGAPGRQCVARSLRDPTEPLRLGLWLAERSGVPFTDRATARDRDAELAEALALLENLDRPGRLLARLVKKRAPTTCHPEEQSDEGSPTTGGDPSADPSGPRSG